MIKLNVGNTNQIKDALRKELSKLQGNEFVTVGIHEDENARPDGEINNATLGAIQHFGTDNIPARPWLDVGVSQSEQQYLQIIADGLGDGLTITQIHERLGLVATASVQQYMVDLRTPPNAASTIAAKRSSNPLIDTGELRQSVSYKVVTGKPAEGIQ
jgi:hypothetical protein